MKAYILGSYSASGLKGVIASGYAGRREAIDKLCSSLDMVIHDVAFTRGEFDVTVTFEVDSEESALGLLLAIKSSGGFDKAICLTELDIDVVAEHARKAGASYVPPNA